MDMNWIPNRGRSFVSSDHVKTICGVNLISFAVVTPWSSPFTIRISGALPPLPYSYVIMALHIM
jgi:hypothetical protein